MKLGRFNPNPSQEMIARAAVEEVSLATHQWWLRNADGFMRATG